MKVLRLPIAIVAIASAASVSATMRFVDAKNTNPVPPYTNLATAAVTIQDAVDVALAGDTVLVASGVYAAGGRAVFGTMTNRVAIDRVVALESLMGPEVTIIQGAKASGGGNGDGAIRCAYLTNGASLSGFTLINGATRHPYDIRSQQSGGGGLWCESESAVVSNCTLIGNSAHSGGGAYGGTLRNCILIGNSAAQGGGAYGDWQNSCTLDNCTLTANSADTGGAARGAALINCTVASNTAAWGGGTYGASLHNCTLIGNWAGANGGGAYAGTLNNCTVRSNSAAWDGGGVEGGTWGCTLNNCTLIGNSAANSGGGAAYDTSLNNCIVYFNTAASGTNYLAAWSVSNCCTTPQPYWSWGSNSVIINNNNITNAPLFVDAAGGNLRLQSNSPCINAGRNGYVQSQTDADGSPRIVGGTVDIGAYEFQSPASIVSYAWLQHYNLPIDGSADYADPDGDGHNSWQEWRCRSDPTNTLSALRLLMPSTVGSNLLLTWQTVSGVSYFLERSTDLVLFEAFATNLAGLPSQTSFTDTNAVSRPVLFYRVGVQD